MSLTADDAAFDGQPYDDASWSTSNWSGTTVAENTPITYEEKTSENTFTAERPPRQAIIAPTSPWTA